MPSLSAYNMLMATFVVLVGVLMMLGTSNAVRVPQDAPIQQPSSNIWDDVQAKLPSSCNITLKGGPSRLDFPKDFMFGFATAAYQIEGAPAEDGKGPSIWDYFAHLPGERREDIQLMKATGVEYYRFSIAWSRVLPEGRGRVNEEGVRFYSDFIDALLLAGIEPVVTLYHWDLPMALLEEYGGWLDLRIVKDFEEYAGLCFSLWGHQVRTWFTLNEPDWCSNGGFSRGVVAPGRCSDRSVCEGGDSTTEPYRVMHNFVVAHATAARLYRRKFQGLTGGRVGIIIDPWFMYPLTDSASDQEAATTAQIFATSLFFDPIFFGDYPDVVKAHVGDRLVPFTPEEAALVKGSADFYGLNFYTAGYATWASNPPGPPAGEPIDFDHDSWASLSKMDTEGHIIGEETASSWLHVVPRAMKDILLWITQRYDGIPIIIGENGMSDKNDPAIPLEKALCDHQRVGFYQGYLANVAKAIKLGANVQGYFAWSLLDNFEWSMGYSERFGIHFVNYTDPARPRYAKASAYWWTGFLKDTAPSKTEVL
eukprot:jgi/Mesen1/7830/ME000417S07138